jgi:hypothetical protein
MILKASEDIYTEANLIKIIHFDYKQYGVLQAEDGIYFVQLTYDTNGNPGFEDIPDEIFKEIEKKYLSTSYS